MIIIISDVVFPCARKVICFHRLHIFISHPRNTQTTSQGVLKRNNKTMSITKQGITATNKKNKKNKMVNSNMWWHNTMTGSWTGNIITPSKPLVRDLHRKYGWSQRGWSEWEIDQKAIDLLRGLYWSLYPPPIVLIIRSMDRLLMSEEHL